MLRKGLAAKLRAHRKWVERGPQHRATPENSRKAQNILVGCVQTFNRCRYCGRSLRDWPDWKPGRRQLLQQIGHEYRTKAGMKALLELLDLAISEVEPAIWLDKVPVMALPVRRAQEPSRNGIERFSWQYLPGLRNGRLVAEGI